MSNARDENLHSILSTNPQAAYKQLRSVKSTKTASISELKVGDKVFRGEKVANSFHEHIKDLKMKDDDIKNCPSCESFKFDYKLIREISMHNRNIPKVTLAKAETLLHSLRPHVCDHYNITALHYIHGGPSALLHFQFLLNSAIENIEATSCDEFNIAHACVLYKGHSKDKNLSSSYRTLSSCPFTAKCLDFYVRELSISEWSEAKAETQFLGPGMSHELGALLLSETITHSINSLNAPLFCLFLDARSAFEIISRKLHLIGTSGHRLLYIDNRLKHQKTFLEWNNKVLGPIHDEIGFKQGGVSSCELYVAYSNQHLDAAQDSGLGVTVGDVNVAAVGQADDVALVSNDIFFLKNLLQLSLDYCIKHHVILAPEKTKLLVFSAPRHKKIVEQQVSINTLSINNIPIKISSVAEYVGVLRSPDGNLPHILGRISSHSKALFSVLPAGLAENHNSNPGAALKVQALSALPVLLSGMATLCLSSSEINILSLHYKKTLQRLMRLPDKCPDPVVFFLAGSLPFSAHLHVRQLGLFGMITRLPDNILNKMANKALFSEPDSSKSWFIHVRHLCHKYNLPSPLQLLSHPRTKSEFKSLVKSAVTNFWEKFLRSEASLLPSLSFFKPHFMSLTCPHPMFTSCDSNPFEVNKSISMAALLSGRYKSDYLARHWDQDNKDGHCRLCPGSLSQGDILHLLVLCPTLQETRDKLVKHWVTKTADHPQLSQLIFNKLSSPTSNLLQFILDLSVDPQVISDCQVNAYNLQDVFSLCRTWCYSVTRKRNQLMGKTIY